jgi:hypothetical protein
MYKSGRERPESHAIPMGFLFVAERFAPIVGAMNKVRLLPNCRITGGIE